MGREWWVQNIYKKRDELRKRNLHRERVQYIQKQKKKSYNRCRKKAVVTRTKNLEREADTHGENERKLVTHKREIPNGEENVTYDYNTEDKYTRERSKGIGRKRSGMKDIGMNNVIKRDTLRKMTLV